MATPQARSHHATAPVISCEKRPAQWPPTHQTDERHLHFYRSNVCRPLAKVAALPFSLARQEKKRQNLASTALCTKPSRLIANKIDTRFTLLAVRRCNIAGANERACHVDYDLRPRGSEVGNTRRAIRSDHRVDRKVAAGGPITVAAIGDIATRNAIALLPQPVIFLHCFTQSALL